MAQSKLVSGLQCSNCGGYMVYDTVSTGRLLRRRTQVEVLARRRRIRLALICLTGVLVSWFVGGSLEAINATAMEQAHCVDFSTCPPQYQPVFATFVVLYILGAILALAAIVLFLRNLRRGQIVRLHEYRCRLCGYAWEWREDQPKPEFGPITPKPDLIRKGEERLRRQAQIAAADAYQRQLRGEL